MSITEQLYESFGNLPSRRGRGGVYTYIRSKDVFDRLNKVFGVNWSSEVKSYEIVGNNVIMNVRVTIKDPETNEYYFQEGFGGAPVNQNEAGDPFKSAYTKALKDACKRWGLGLYKDDETFVNAPAQTQSTQSSEQIPSTPLAPPQPSTPVVEQSSTQKSTTPPLPSTPPVGGAPAEPVLPASVPSQEQVEELVPDQSVQQPAQTQAPILPPNVPKVVQEEVTVTQMPETPPTPPVPEAPAQPQQQAQEQPAAAVEPPVPQTPPMRPADVPLNPTERVKKQRGEQALPQTSVAQPTSPQSATESEISNNEMITDVQKVAIQGLVGMKGLNYDDIARKALSLPDGSAVPPVETLSYAQAIEVIRYIHDLYK